ncbi:hypothetical protein C1646_763972 [Rhizophagus diaphanus]|nr:hypothetical protein C1646_763972 [Rhizophagus diaphanus] [Rhizophagus sp. MUCL 43196]
MEFGWGLGTNGIWDSSNPINIGDKYKYIGRLMKLLLPQKLRDLKKIHENSLRLKATIFPSKELNAKIVDLDRPSSITKNKILTIPEDLLPFVPDSPLYSNSDQLLTPGTSAYLNNSETLNMRTRKLSEKKTMELNLIHDLTHYLDIHYKEMSS